MVNPENAVCIKLYIPDGEQQEKFRLGYPNDNRCVAGHPWCHAYRHIPEMKINPSDEYKIKKAASL